MINRTIHISTAVFLADSCSLSTRAIGAYGLLLLFASLSPTGDLPDCDRELARMVRLSQQQWASVREELANLWAAHNGRFRYVGRCLEAEVRRSIPIAVRRAVIERDGNECRYCGDTSGPFEFDHVLPWSRGGQDTVENIVRACAPCNREKSDRTPEEMGWAL